MTILICDDDHSTVDVLSSQIDFQRYGIDSILRAYNGKAAMEIIEEKRPELILCDIDMPQANGIDVLKKVYDLKYLNAFAFLTAYESFSYARDALRYGAVNYLTKPFSIEEVEDCIEGMTAYVDQQSRLANLAADTAKSRTAEGNDEVASPARAVKRDEINSTLRAIRDGFFGEDKVMIQKVLESRSLSIHVGDEFRCVSIRVNLQSEKTRSWDPQLLHYSFRYLAQEAVADRLDFTFFLVDPDGTIDLIQLLIPAKQFSEEELIKRCRTLIRMTKQNLGVEPVLLIGESRPVYQLQRITEEKKRIEQLRLQEGKIFLPGDKEEERAEGANTLLLQEDTVLSSVQQRNKAQYMKAVGDLAQKISDSGSGSEWRMAQLHHDLLQTLFKCLSDNQLQTHILFDQPNLRELDHNAERSVFDFIRFSSQFYDETVKALNTLEGSTDILVNVKKYIQEHFREDIDRNDIAQVAYITPNYLSKRFRQDTGMSLRDYINKLRVKESKRLLVTTSVPVSTIAMEVGFGNISYFSTVFRKYTGTSPIEWRENPKLRIEDETDE